MGPVKDMRKLWTRAQEYSEQNPKIVGLDQECSGPYLGRAKLYARVHAFHRRAFGYGASRFWRAIDQVQAKKLYQKAIVDDGKVAA